MLNENIRNIFYIKIKNKNVYSQFDELFIIMKQKHKIKNYQKI